MSWIRRALLSGAAGIVAGAALTASQAPGTGTLNGDVVDADCEVRYGATVTARRLDGEFTQTAITDRKGTFSLGGLPAGAYKLTATLPGFRAATRTAIDLRAGATVSSSLAMDIGQFTPLSFDSGPPRPSGPPPIPRETCVPVDMSRGVMIVRARLNDYATEPVWMILDSGASVTVVAEALATARGMDVRPAGEMQSGIGEGRARLGRIPRLSMHIAGAQIDTTTAVTLPLGSDFGVIDHAVDGVLGSEVFLKFVVRIDYATASVRFFDPGTFDYKGPGVPVPITLAGNSPEVRVQVEAGGRPLAATVEVDTGSDGTVGLNRPFVDANHLLDGRPTVAGYAMGVGGEASMTIGRIDALRLGPFIFANPVVGFSRASQGNTASKSRDGIMGAAILHRFTLYLDYPHRRIILEPNAQLGDPFDFDLSGAVLARNGTAPARIQAVRPGTPAAALGLVAGDELISIDGRATTDLPLDTIARWLRIPDRDFRLGLRRAGQPVEVVLHTKRLI
ncbi:MAG TPA: carboxypeptidase regulatory-like domain-containing protein [Vicinamibacterales bacterium]|nr:carboxypeptidase regulatory-like domain-containing protein [Vicinamibacterales bacterium]